MEVDSAEGASQMETDEIDIPEPEVAKLWSQLFRVMDDVHEGTRLAAEGTAKTLSKVRNFSARIISWKAKTDFLPRSVLSQLLVVVNRPKSWLAQYYR